MKDIRRVLGEVEARGGVIIKQMWGESAGNVMEKVAKGFGGEVFVVTKKTFGMKRVILALEEAGFGVEVVAKGRGDERLIRVVFGEGSGGEKGMVREAKPNEKWVEFSIFGRDFKADVGEAVFSKKGLDKGTRFLLEKAVDGIRERGFGEMAIGDLGAGWGAISMVLAEEFPEARIVAIEREGVAARVCRKNLSGYNRVEVIEGDVNDVEILAKFRGKFDVLVANFAFHIESAELKAFVESARGYLKEGGGMFIVTEGRFVKWFGRELGKVLRVEEKWEMGRYCVMEFFFEGNKG